MPFFSVVITTYNRAHLINETIISVLDQEFIDFELIIIDDGSNDETFDQCISKIDDSRIRYYYQENTERGEARNNGIKRAKGEYVIFMDSDDIMLRHYLKELYAQILRYPNILIHSCRLEYFYENGEIKKNLKDYPAGIYGIEAVIGGNSFGINFCIKNDLQKIKLFEPDRKYSIMEDWIFLCENLYHNKLALNGRVSLRMRDHINRSMRSSAELLSKKRIIATDRIIEKIKPDTILEKKLWRESFKFCATHYYIDGHSKKALLFWWKYIKLANFNLNSYILLAKIITGKRLIEMLKNVIR